MRNYGDINKKALEILIKYWNVELDNIPLGDFNYAKEKGYMFEDITSTHDESIQELFKTYEELNKRQVVNTFLASMSTNQISWRMGLAVFAIMQSFPKHSFISTNADKSINSTTPCKVCSSYPNFRRNMNYNNLLRIATGQVRHDCYSYLFYIQEQLKLSNDIVPQENDLVMFKEMINLILNCDESATPNKILKNIKKSKVFKLSDQDQLHRLLEILGYCSVLSTSDHKGPLYEFTNLATAPRKSRSSDWNYPIDFWTGKSGINVEAYNFWFGNYSELILKQ